MGALIAPLAAAGRPAAAKLLDDAVGAGFWSFDEPAGELAFVASSGAAVDRVVLGRLEREAVDGVVLGRLERADDPDVPAAFGAAGTPAAGGRVLHVRAVAVAPAARRRGLARGLLARCETEAATRGATAAYLFAWLPAGRPEPAAVPLYVAAGYTALPDIADFYAAGSLASGALCPYCGAPPCRCATRPFVKQLPPA